MIICLHTVIFLFNTNNLHTAIWLQVLLPDTNDLFTVIWFQGFSNTYI